jgi:hypothetical protein
MSVSEIRVNLAFWQSCPAFRCAHAGYASG